ncbi:MAG: urease accessory protein UreD [Dehalococcoidia bacterium]|nr:urease accessory protein UreD [Dehalococcoidia bacterium]
MTVSRARLVAVASAGRTRAAVLAAAAPQRWSNRPGAAPPWAEVTHQLVGDGIFGGDAVVTSVRAGPGAALLVDAVAATPLRGGAPSLSATRLRADPGATLIHVPGMLIPHAGADHAASLAIDVAPGARVLSLTAVAAGRMGMQESGAFARLELRTRATVAGQLAFAERAVLTGAEFAAASAGAPIVVTALALGDWPAAEPSWWPTGLPGVTGGASQLRSGGAAYRALCDTYADFEALAAAVVGAARSRTCEPQFAASCKFVTR